MTLAPAAAIGDTGTVRVLLANKANVHACDSYGKPDEALRQAASNGHTDTVRVLLAHKADVHACGWDGKPDAALRVAAYNGHTDTVRVLLQHKANVHVCDIDGTPDEALRDAAYCGHTDTVRVLLEHKADVHAGGNEWDRGRPDAALRWAAEKGYAETVRVLLQAGADVRLCPATFVETHLSFQMPIDPPVTVAASVQVSRVGLCVRLGVRVLRALAAAHAARFRASDFDRARVHCECEFNRVWFIGRDLCDLVLWYT